MTDARLPLSDFLAYIARNEIPPLPPEFASYGGTIYPFEYTHMAARDACLHRGMFAIVDQVWTRALADWIGQRTVLEVMAGAGWLAKALRQHGIDIVATDDNSWHNLGNDDVHFRFDLTPVSPIERLDAQAAITKYADRDILLVSWPPMEEAIADACTLWGVGKPIVFIGEGDGGCTASENFFAHFCHDESLIFPMLAWPMVHDFVQVGTWKEAAT